MQLYARLDLSLQKMYLCLFPFMRCFTILSAQRSEFFYDFCYDFKNTPYYIHLIEIKVVPFFPSTKSLLYFVTL